jgi:hypothetical protein
MPCRSLARVHANVLIFTTADSLADPGTAGLFGGLPCSRSVAPWASPVQVSVAHIVDSLGRILRRVPHREAVSCAR